MPEVVVVPLAGAAPSKPKQHLAPAGVVYLTKRISVTTDTSVIGMPEGTRVDVIERRGGRIAGQIGPMAVEIAEEDTSNDLDLIAGIVKKRAEAEATLTSKVDPLQEAGIHLPEAKPPTLEERKVARLEKLKKVHELQTRIEDARKQLAELNTLKIETFRKNLSKAKSNEKKTGKEKIEVLDPALDTSIQDLKDSIERDQKELVELRFSLGLG